MLDRSLYPMNTWSKMGKMTPSLEVERDKYPAHRTYPEVGVDPVSSSEVFN